MKENREGRSLFFCVGVLRTCGWFLRQDFLSSARRPRAMPPDISVSLSLCFCFSLSKKPTASSLCWCTDSNGWSDFINSRGRDCEISLVETAGSCFFYSSKHAPTALWGKGNIWSSGWRPTVRSRFARHGLLRSCAVWLDNIVCPFYVFVCIIINF